MSNEPAAGNALFRIALRHIMVAAVQILALLFVAAVIGTGIWLLFQFPAWDALLWILWLSTEALWVSLTLALIGWLFYSRWARRQSSAWMRPAFRWPTLPAKPAAAPAFSAPYFWTVYALVMLCHLGTAFILYYVLFLACAIAAFILIVGIAVLPMWLLYVTPQEQPWLFLVWWPVCAYGVYRLGPRLRHLWTFPKHRLLRFLRFTERVLTYLSAQEAAAGHSRERPRIRPSWDP